MDQIYTTSELRPECAALWNGVETPSVAVIITHHDYSDYLEECISSTLDQTYVNVDVVIVDDFSKRDHLERASEIIGKFSPGKVKFVKNGENKGQVLSFYEGLDQTDADFVVLLDPDDRLHPEFCREMVCVHLNSDIYCGQASCNQIFVRDNVVLTGTSGNMRPDATREVYRLDTTFDIRYIGALLPGWHWPSTSSLVFRRDAVELFRPQKKRLETRAAADAYFAPAIHMIGGSIHYSKPLVLRNFHSRNTWLNDRIISRLTTQQGKFQEGEIARKEALESLFSNTRGEILTAPMMRTTLEAHLTADQREELSRISAEAAAFLEKTSEKIGWLRSLERKIRSHRKRLFQQRKT